MIECTVKTLLGTDGFEMPDRSRDLKRDQRTIALPPAADCDPEGIVAP